MPTTCRIITTGYPTAESSEDHVLERLTVLLKNEQKARMLLSGTRRTIKSRLSESAAMKYFQAFSSAGLVVKVEPETPVKQSREETRAMAEATPPISEPPPAPENTAEKTSPPAEGSGDKYSPKRQPNQRPPKEKAVTDSGAGLLGNLVGFVCGGAIFSLARVLLIPLTGSEIFAHIAASLLGLVVWRKTANAFRR